MFIFCLELIINMIFTTNNVCHLNSIVFTLKSNKKNRLFLSLCENSYYREDFYFIREFKDKTTFKAYFFYISFIVSIKVYIIMREVKKKKKFHRIRRHINLVFDLHKKRREIY